VTSNRIVRFKGECCECHRLMGLMSSAPNVGIGRVFKPLSSKVTRHMIEGTMTPCPGSNKPSLRTWDSRIDGWVQA